MNCCTQYFIWEKYAYFCDILIEIKLYAQNVQPKIHLDVVIREDDIKRMQIVVNFYTLSLINTLRYHVLQKPAFHLWWI